MKTKIALPLFFIFIASSLCQDVKNPKKLLKTPSPFLLPLLDPSCQYDNSVQNVEDLINEVLLNPNKNRFLWIDLLRKKVTYEFWRGPGFESLKQELEYLHQQTERNYKEFIVMAQDAKLVCENVSNKYIFDYEQKLKLTLTASFDKFTDYRKKGLLYQIIPAGTFDASITDFIFHNDFFEFTSYITNKLSPLFDCFDFHAKADRDRKLIEIKREPLESKGIFKRFWNWLKSLFGYGDQNKEIKNNLESGIISSKMMTPIIDFPKVMGDIIVGKNQEYRAFIKELEVSADRQIEIYSQKLKKAIDLFRNPARHFRIIFQAILREHRLTNNYDAELFNARTAPIHEYLLRFNCEYNKEQKCTYTPYPEFESEITTMAFNLNFSQKLDEDETDTSDIAKKFSLKTFSNFIKNLINMDQKLTISFVQEYWARFNVNRRQNQMNSQAKSDALEKLILEKNAQIVSLPRRFCLIYEILAYLPRGEDLVYKTWLPKALEYFMDFNNFENDNLFLLGTYSKIMHLDPIGDEESISDYYDTLENLVKEYFSFVKKTKAKFQVRSGQEIGKLSKLEEFVVGESFGINSFPVGFDMFLEMMIDKKDLKSEKFYIALKVHNLWAANNDLLLRTITFRKMESRNVLEVNNEFLNAKNMVGFKFFLSKILESKKVITNTNEVKESIADRFSGLTLLRSDVANLFPELSTLLNTSNILIIIPKRNGQII